MRLRLARVVVAVARVAADVVVVASRAARTKTRASRGPTASENQPRAHRMDDDDDDDDVRVYARDISHHISPSSSRVERALEHLARTAAPHFADTNPNPPTRDRRITADDDDGADDDAERDGDAVARGDEKYMYVCE